MKLVKLLVLVIAVLVIAAIAVWFFKSSHKADSAEADEESPVPVEVAKIERKTLAEPEIAYGSVIAQPASVQVQSVAFESQVRHVLVAPGQIVRAGEVLVEITPSAAARLELQQAQSAATAAHRDLEQTQARFAMKLATNQDLGTSQKAAADADLQLQTLQENHQSVENGIVAAMDGIVAKVDAQDGQIVAAGGAIVETVAEDAVEARLGIDPESLDLLKPGVEVKVEPVSGNAQVSGTVGLITRTMDPDTRLVDVFVLLPPKSGLLLDEYVKGTFNRVADDVLAVPAGAVESDENGTCIFTVENGKSVRHSVDEGVEAGGEIAVSGSGLSAGMTIVTVGSHEVSDGAAVKLPGADDAK